MRRALAIAVVLLGGSLMGMAQDSAAYLELRQRYRITQASGPLALASFVGSRVLEVRGTVRGTVGAGASTLVLIEVPGGADLAVHATDPPSWLVLGPVSARLLIRAERASESGRLHAELLAAAPDYEITRIEEEARREKARQEARAAARARPRVETRPPRDWQLPASDALPYYAAFIKGRNPRLTDAQATEIAHGIIGFSIQFGVDARLIMAMVLVESNFDPRATSRKGAMGLGQLMPGTARGLGVTDAYDTMDNLYGTVKLVRRHLETYRNRTGESYRSLLLALAAYNAGAGAVRRHDGIPPYRETQNYVRKVVEVYRQLTGS